MNSDKSSASRLLKSKHSFKMPTSAPQKLKQLQQKLPKPSSLQIADAQIAIAEAQQTIIKANLSLAKANETMTEANRTISQATGINVAANEASLNAKVLHGQVVDTVVAANEASSNAKALNEDSEKAKYRSRLEGLIERLKITQSKCKFNLFPPGPP
ncbi:hypothetical protein ABVK25_000769 [Lepraria finkii]|uniref:Uncharacterized protein n=1 Tax=Lepraria finkii TaxID=1340010 RepID=A0ABR4BR10_9LECA